MSRALTVLDAGPLTTVQDGGRPGHAHLGVPRSGWLDAPAARLANRLVGNDAGAALLETTVGGVALAGRGGADRRGHRRRGRRAGRRARRRLGRAGLAAGRCRAARRAPPVAASAATSRWPAGSTSRRCSGRGPPTGSPGSVRRRWRTGRCCRSDPDGRPRPARRAPAWPRPTACSGWRRAAGGLGRPAAYDGWPRRPGPSPPTPTASPCGWPARRWTGPARGELPSEGMVLGARPGAAGRPAAGVPGRPPDDGRLPGRRRRRRSTTCGSAPSCGRGSRSSLSATSPDSGRGGDEPARPRPRATAPRSVAVVAAAEPRATNA